MTQWKGNKYKNSVSVRECLNLPVLRGMVTGRSSEERSGDIREVS